MPDAETPLRVLIVEDSPDDAALIAHELHKAGYQPAWERVETAEAMRAALQDRAWDIIISDYVVPGFGGMQALQVSKDSGLEIPFIIISGKVDEETLINVVKAGASDFLVKGRIGRLDSVIRRELAVAETRRNIHQAEIHWRTAFDAVRDAIFVHDAELRILRANLAYAALAGMPIQDIIGKPFWEVFPRTGKPLPGSKSAMASGKWVEEEVQLPGGVTYLSRAFPILSGAGKYLYSLNILLDITERNRVRDAVEASERRFRALSEHGSDLVVVVDKGGKVTYISPSIKRLGGYEVEEAVGRSYLEFAHPDDRASSLAGFAQLLREPALRRTTEYRFQRKDGEWEILESIAWNALADPLINGIVINARVITERKQALAALERSERHFRKLIEGGADAFFVMDHTGNVVYRSPSGKQLTGWSDEDVMGRSITQYIVPEDLPLVQATIAETIRNPGKTAHVELRMLRKDGKVVPVEATGRNLFADPDVGGIVVTAREISERKLAEQKLRESESRYRGIFEHAKDVIYMIDAAGAFIALSPSFEKVTGWSTEEWLHKPFDTIVHPDDHARAVEILRQTVSQQVSSEFEMRIGRKSGGYWTGEFTVSPLEVGGSTILFGIARDITERKQAQEALNASRDLLSSVVEHAPVRVFWKDLELRYLGCNSSFARDAGMARPEDVIGKDDFQMGWRDRAEQYRADDRQVIDSNTPRLHIQELLSTPDGRSIWISTSKVPLSDSRGKTIGMLGIFEDITERKRADEELKRLNWAMRALSESSSSLVHASSDAELFDSCCKAITSAGAYPLAWIGLTGDDPGRPVVRAAAEGAAIAYMDGLTVSTADVPMGDGPTGVSIRTNTTQVLGDFSDSAAFAPWRERARENDLASSISLPIRANGMAIGALVVYSRHVNAFGKAEIELFEALAQDISYGIAARGIREAYDTSVVERSRGAEKLRRSLEDSIQAIAATVEMRDPYTAGHERRVAELAAAIATEMGLPPFTVEGIHFGGMIHDLGKIQVPAEILSKPTRLAPLEFELIKGHAQAGYEILKGIEYPWPVAEMARQHHERLDGSGYPQGLKGEEILLEARVLAVADTVEAMSSHRPYRPGLGIEAALAEIEKNAGRLYDAGAVAAALRLFRGRGYEIAA